MSRPITVFSDLHHNSLYNSLRLLFEKRMGGVLLRPIGKSWFERGYWRMAEIYQNSPVTIEQYLGTGNLAPDNNGIYEVYDTEYEYYQKAIKVNTFFNLPIDIVIASLPEHIASFSKLASEHPNKPKFVFQVGNAWTVSEGYAKNILASAIIPNVPPGTNIITYHQPFDLDIFWPSLNVAPPQNIYSFINCLNTAQHYTEDWILFQEVEKLMSEWSFKSYGGSCRDGAMHGAKALADKMREARFIWHTKRWGDGYGHILHNSFAVARPVIIKMSDYEGKLGGLLLEDGKTCINIDNLSPQEIVSKINHYNDIRAYTAMCENVHKRFKEVVNFDREFEQIKVFLANLL